MKVTAGRRETARTACMYFLVSIDAIRSECHHALMAVTELVRPQLYAEAAQYVQQPGHALLIDSGVYSLCAAHARAHSLTLPETFGLRPDLVDGWSRLFDDYVSVATTLGPHSWGYIELDLGGRDAKCKTRQQLEGMGLVPIPVYHPLNDGWDYFDELAAQYDRVCIGNMVSADRMTRIRFLATLWERRASYPHLWLHLLGYTVDQYLWSYPFDSCDSSTWLDHIRWGGRERAMGRQIGLLRETRVLSRRHGVLMGFESAQASEIAWNQHTQELIALNGGPLWA